MHVYSYFFEPDFDISWHRLLRRTLQLLKRYAAVRSTCIVLNNFV